MTEVCPWGSVPPSAIPPPRSGLSTLRGLPRFPQGGKTIQVDPDDRTFHTGISVFDGLFGPFLRGSVQMLVGRTGLAFDLLDRLVVHAAQRQVPSYYIDGGHRADPFAMARVLRMQRIDPRRPLERVIIARAFTAHQMDSLIDLELPKVDPPPGLLVVSSMDRLFSDPEVDQDESRGMMENCLRTLRAQAGRGACVVLAAAGGGRESELLNMMGRECSNWASFKERARGRVRIVVKGGGWTDISPLHPLQTIMEDFLDTGAKGEVS